ncbi:MAG: hypothetical protein GY828_02560 [Candidatus Gracilibacteria bacterium]|nr:hypothetical protein [Candidatus Gracilibacteria bacterium]
MKKEKNTILKLSVHIITFLFFMGFVYFSYFLTKEMLVVKYITPQDYSYKHYAWEIEHCTQGAYEYKYGDRYYSNEIKENKNLSTEEKQEKIEKEKLRRKIKCLETLHNKSENRQYVDFKIASIKYGLATLFFFILFMAFATQSFVIHKKNDK